MLQSNLSDWTGKTFDLSDKSLTFPCRDDDGNVSCHQTVWHGLPVHFFPLVQQIESRKYCQRDMRGCTSLCVKATAFCPMWLFYFIWTSLITEWAVFRDRSSHNRRLSGLVCQAYISTEADPWPLDCVELLHRWAASGITWCQGDRGSATIGFDSSFIMAEVSVPLNRAHFPP